MNLISLFFVALAALPISHQERQNSVSCMNWTLGHFPEINNRSQYIADHNMLVETVGTAPNQIRVFHTEMGTFLSFDGSDEVRCRASSNAFGGNEVQGIYHYTALALNEKLKGLREASESGFWGNLGEIRASLNFFKSIPTTCVNGHSVISDLIAFYCRDLRQLSDREIISNQINQIEVCRK